MKITSLSNHKIYLNVSQNQIYTASRLKKLFKKWANDLESNKMSQNTFKKLRSTHFENLKEIPKYEIKENKKHSIQCSYATECSCECWCKSKFHGSKIRQGAII